MRSKNKRRFSLTKLLVAYPEIFTGLVELETIAIIKTYIAFSSHHFGHLWEVTHVYMFSGAPCIKNSPQCLSKSFTCDT
jgi:hypothetical protein